MTTLSDWPLSNTDHGLLVAFGEFLQQHGLIENLMQVPVAQKTVPGAILVLKGVPAFQLPLTLSFYT
jgi:hypothetical protein